MWLAICSSLDEACLWAVLGLRHLGVEPLEVVVPEELVAGATLVHRVGSAGGTAQLRLADGRELHDGSLRGVLNRLVEVPPAWLEQFGPSDRDYVAEELQAALASWLYSLACPVLNPPSPACLCGEWRSVPEWRRLAAQTGLDVVPYRASGFGEPESVAGRRRVLLVVGSEVTAAAGPVAEPLANGCVALAAAAGTPLLGVEFLVGPDGGWRFDVATPFPDLRHGGAAGLLALQRGLGA